MSQMLRGVANYSLSARNECTKASRVFDMKGFVYDVFEQISRKRSAEDKLEYKVELLDVGFKA